MSRSRRALAAAVLGCVAFARAQAPWRDNVANVTMCNWEEPRVAVLRDTLYIDGGYLWWLPGLINGGTGSVAADNATMGIVWTLNFSHPFDTSQNVTALMGTVAKGLGGSANNFAPNYVDGAMLANNDEWLLYGGMPLRSDIDSPPPKDQVFGYRQYQYGDANKPLFSPGIFFQTLPDNLTRYVAYGGAASAPSEQKAWYFGGMQTPTAGQLFYLSDAAHTATNKSNTLITLDLSKQGNEMWTNHTLRGSVTSRANPDVVWVPVGSEGILVVLGGVVYPEWSSANRRSANPAQSKLESPKFMSNIDIYDIANDKWYQQPTVMGPGQLTRGCAVVAPSSDYSSFNIYYYGGFDGLDSGGTYSDEVWVLSLPSFMWMKVNSGNPDHARVGHKCVMPYPDQMMVVGGYTNDLRTCVLGSVIQMFNLSSATWMSSYDPAKHDDYGVPQHIYEMIGGNAAGGATMTTPTPSGWADPGLAEVFKTPYPTSKITPYYPYPSVAAQNNTNPNVPDGGGGSGGGGLPSWAPIVLGVVLGLVFVTCLGVAILLWRRRKILRRNMSVAGTEDTNGRRIISWMRGQNHDAKAPTVTTDEALPTSPEMEHLTANQQQSQAHAQAQYQHPQPYQYSQDQEQSVMEMADTQIIPPVELPDTSQPMELHDSPLTPAEIMDKHTNLGRNGNGNGSLNLSSYSTVSPPDQASTVSRSSGPTPAPPGGSSGLNRPSAPKHISFEGTPAARANDSSALNSPGMDPALSQAAVATARSPTPTRHFESGVSGISEADRRHLRQTSDTTVSSIQSGGDRPMQQAPTSIPASVPEQITPATPSPGESLGFEGPVSPPSAGVMEGVDYVTARPSLAPYGGNNITGSSPLRMSVPQESHENLSAEAQRQRDQRGDTA